MPEFDGGPWWTTLHRALPDETDRAARDSAKLADANASSKGQAEAGTARTLSRETQLLYLIPMIWSRLANQLPSVGVTREASLRGRSVLA